VEAIAGIDESAKAAIPAEIATIFMLTEGLLLVYPVASGTKKAPIGSRSLRFHRNKHASRQDYGAFEACSGISAPRMKTGSVNSGPDRLISR
jgi:hypothetical protein